MTPDSASRVLVLGGHDSGKTTLLVQLHGRIKAGAGSLSSHGAPASLTPIEDGLHRLEQGLKVKHTGLRTKVELTVPAVTDDGTTVDITVPDYAGEDLRARIADRRVDERWRRHDMGRR